MKRNLFLGLVLLGSLAKAAPFSEAQFVETYLQKNVKPEAPKSKAKLVIKVPAKPVIVLTPTQKLYSLMGTDHLWVEAGVATPLAAGLREALKGAARQGLNPNSYWTETIEAQYQAMNSESAAQFETEMTALLLKYANDLSVGRVDPSKVGDEVKLTKKTLSIEKVAAALKNTSLPVEQSLDSLAPQWSQYQKLQQALMQFLKINPEIEFPPVMAPKKKVKVGDKDVLFSNVKIRLKTLGYPLSETGVVYTSELQATITRYMSDHSLQGTANMNPGSNFLAHLGAPLSARLQQILLSMEKLRWLPDAPENRHLVVNLALQRLRVFENGQVVLAMKTINGKPSRMSPMLRDKIVAVELNPAWTVPVSLILKDKLPAIQANPNFLEEHNFRIFNGDMTREMSGYEVDWFNVNKQTVGEINLQQRPGLGNALGIMKFHLTNAYSIYLHDTNERNLFPDNFRLLSSGCVRLERPLDLAQYIFKDDPKWGNPIEIESRLAVTPVADWGVEVQKIIGVRQSLPVYLMYITAEVDENGITKFAGDFYGQDSRLYELMKAEGI